MEPDAEAAGEGIGRSGTDGGHYSARRRGVGAGTPDGVWCSGAERCPDSQGAETGGAGDAVSYGQGAEVQAGGALLCGVSGCGAAGYRPYLDSGAETGR